MKLSEQVFTERVYQALGSPTESELPKVELLNSLNFAMREFGYFRPKYFSHVEPSVTLNTAIDLSAVDTNTPILDVETVFAGDCSDYGTPRLVYRINDDIYSGVTYKELEYHWDDVAKEITIWDYEDEVTIWLIAKHTWDQIPERFYQPLLFAAQFYCLDFIIMVRARIMELRGTLRVDLTNLKNERDRVETLYKRGFKFA